MINALYTGKAAAMAQQKRLDVISNNLANVNTYGYKASSVSFQDTLYNNMVNPDGYDGRNLRRGSGVRVAAIDYNLVAGNTNVTGQLLDFTIVGDGYFMVESENGEVNYTREGFFGIDKGANGNYLVTAKGYYVLDENGARIRLPEDEGELQNLTVDENGAMSVDGIDGEVLAVLGIRSFPHPYGLEKVGNNLYRESPNSGVPYAGESRVVQGALEGSNVNMAQEMVLSIRTSRAFSLASRCITTADEMDGLANTIRG